MSEANPLPPGFAGTYQVHLLLDRPQALNPQTLLQNLNRRCEQTESIQLSESPGFYAFAQHEYPVHYGEGDVPAQSFISVHDTPLNADVLESSFHQTWDWQQAREIVSGHQASVMVSDLMAAGLPYQARLTLFHNVVLSVLDELSCLAVHWSPSEKLVQPAVYRDSKTPDSFDRLFPAVNVRLFRIQDQQPGEVVMDTVGLAALGLPDLQCHFVNLDVSKMASVLFNSAYYLFEKGDVINDGETIQGITPEQRWHCQHEMSLVAPQREVLDINPGKPYAAGNRN